MGAFRLTVALGLGISLLAGCGADAQFGSALGDQSRSMLRPDSGPCGGNHGVRVTPCPVKLTRATRDTGVTVTVSGPGVTNWSAFVAGCASSSNQAICSVAQLGQTTWRISSNANCGTAEAEFDGGSYNGTGIHAVGAGFLKIVNKYCPQSTPRSTIKRHTSVVFYWKPNPVNLRYNASGGDAKETKLHYSPSLGPVFQTNCDYRRVQITFISGGGTARRLISFMMLLPLLQVPIHAAS